MKARWVHSTLILLALFALLASFVLRGNDMGPVPPNLLVDNELGEDGLDKGVDASSDLNLIVHVAPTDECCLCWRSVVRDEALPGNVLQDRCFGTRGPPALSL